MSRTFVFRLGGQANFGVVHPATEFYFYYDAIDEVACKLQRQALDGTNFLASARLPF
jgi:hypothetical protein